MAEASAPEAVAAASSIDVEGRALHELPPAHPSDGHAEVGARDLRRRKPLGAQPDDTARAIPLHHEQVAQPSAAHTGRSQRTFDVSDAHVAEPRRFGRVRVIALGLRRSTAPGQTCDARSSRPPHDAE